MAARIPVKSWWVLLLVKEIMAVRKCISLSLELVLPSGEWQPDCWELLQLKLE